jgi:hypothetical protein
MTRTTTTWIAACAIDLYNTVREKGLELVTNLVQRIKDLSPVKL